MAPVVHHAIDVKAAPEACWRLFADLAKWPRWFPMCKSANAVGEPWTLGGHIQIVFEAGPLGLPVTVEIKELAPARRVRWEGGRLGVAGNHYYEFAVNSPGLTRVTSHEQFTGMGVKFIPRKVIDRIDGEVHRSMERFKSLVEESAG